MVKNEPIALDTNIVIDVLNNKKLIVESLQDYRKIYLYCTPLQSALLRFGKISHL